MRITIDARMIENSGIGRYIKNLLVRLPELEPSCTFTAIVNSNGLLPHASGGPVVKVLDRPIPIYTLSEQLFLPFETNRARPDLIHYPSFNMPLINTRPVVVTIHDLVYYLFEDACPGRLAHLYARTFFRIVTRAACRIIAISNHTKEDIVKHLGISPEKIDVTPMGVDDTYRPVEDEEFLKTVRERYSIKAPFVLYVGTHHPRKNLLRLVHAFSRVKAAEDMNLVITGKVEKRRSLLYNTVKELGLEERVVFTGYVPERDLPALYTMAELFVFPSLYEGFGIPPIEAMACATPVVSSNTTSLPEVVGDAAVTVDPLDVDAIAGAMERVLSSRDLKDELVEKGLRRAALFRWEDTARKTIEVYKKVLAGR